VGRGGGAGQKAARPLIVFNNPFLAIVVRVRFTLECSCCLTFRFLRFAVSLTVLVYV
jgi:hypothetical protein